MSTLPVSTDRLTQNAGTGPAVRSGVRTACTFSGVSAVGRRRTPNSARTRSAARPPSDGSSGATTTIAAGSTVKWRRMSGNVPWPIEPKPMMTTGPSSAPWFGWTVMEGLLARGKHVGSQWFEPVEPDRVRRRGGAVRQDLDAVADPHGGRQLVGPAFVDDVVVGQRRRIAPSATQRSISAVLATSTLEPRSPAHGQHLGGR